MEKVTVEVFSDMLCVWAYGAQARIDQLKRNFADRIVLQYRFIPLFAATHKRISQGWRARGGYQGFNRHIREIVADWDHVTVHPQLWLENVPPSSNSAHLYAKAAQALSHDDEISPEPQAHLGGRTLFEELVWRIRCHFFEHNINISKMSELNKIADGLGLPTDRIAELISNGEAHAALHLDMEARDEYLVPGSPTLVLNEGRQRLYGNIGYRIIEANIQELLSNHQHGEASWC